jgi:hypothetical protein
MGVNTRLAWFWFVILLAGAAYANLAEKNERPVSETHGAP